MNITDVVDGYPDKNTMEFFESVVSLYRERLKAIASTQPVFKVSLNTLQIGSSAIILRGQDAGQIDAMRSKLIDLPRLGGHVIDAGFIHSTQARYKAQVRVDLVHEQVSDIKIDIPITIDRIGLVRAAANFSKPHVILEEFILKKSPFAL
jgi:hypothetical protein